MHEDSSMKARYVLDLDRSRAPGVFRGHNNLWREDIKRIYRLIGRHVAALAGSQNEPNRRDSDPKQHPHLSIAIFGPSGSGKSSLLRTLEDDANRNQPSVRDEEGLGGKVYSLPVIDPTTWQESDQFLYAFLATALEEELNCQERKEGGQPQGLSPVQLAFQEVNEYLRVVDEQETSEEYDPLGLSLQKLERHTSGLRLREALGKFTRALTKELGAAVILVPVDDLDLAPGHLVKSLQAYQSFLTHAPLVPVFTFTDRMSEELIEAHYEKSVTGSGKIEKRTKKIKEDLDVSEKLAVQFLARCFPVRNRIRMGPAPGRVQRAFFTFQAHKADRGESLPEGFQVLELLTVSSFLLFGHPDNKDPHKVRAALRPSTLRRQLQVVDAMADCRLSAFRAPQLAKMAFEKIDPGALEKIDSYRSDRGVGQEEEAWQEWSKDPNTRRRLGNLWNSEQTELLSTETKPAHFVLAYRLKDLGINATWATIFNGAVWSLLNVHRDTLRELGLFLEDLYSWNPRELRSVVLLKILDQDRATRRTLVDRWFNRTDYRRSQVLSLLAANIFRPWMKGEEPYGDDEVAIHEQRELESDDDQSNLPLDRKWDEKLNRREQTRDRLSIPASQGLLWFIDVTMGFYLPQIMARDWPDRLSTGESVDKLSSREFVKERMSGNGWDLRHAPVSAIRAADAKREIGSFGMVFLDPKGYGKALDLYAEGSRDHLLLRIWTCYGYNRSKFWSAFSLWRGLGFIGQVLELGLKEEQKKELKESDRGRLQEEMKDLIRDHCLAGLMPGSLLGRDAPEDLLYRSFRRWEPFQPDHESAIDLLAKDLMKWLDQCSEDRIFPLPAADVWIGWRECFVRRIHGEYILGSLWPRLNSAYLEKHVRNEACQELARGRGGRPEKPSDDSEGPWTAALAAAIWSDTLLEYWRGCPQILFQLLTCPVFFKSRERIDPEAKDFSPWRERLGNKDFWEKIDGVWAGGSLPCTLVSDILCIERTPARASAESSP